MSERIMPTLTALTDLRRNLVTTIEMVQKDPKFRDTYPLLSRDFRENATLLRDIVSNMQSACAQEIEPQGNRAPTRKERLGLDRDQNSW
jgi:hypothetical protein